MTTETIQQPIRLSKPLPPRVTQIIVDICDEFDVTPEDLWGPKRHRRISWPRHEAMRRIHQLSFKPSFCRIARWFNRDHSTVMFAMTVGDRDLSFLRKKPVCGSDDIPAPDDFEASIAA